MAVLVTGSVAVDHIMIFQDHFKNHFMADKLEKLNVAFHVPSMSKQFGGTGANIAYNLCRLGIEPILLDPFGDWPSPDCRTAADMWEVADLLARG